MSEMVARLDDYGKPAWIAVMVLSFVLFWPAGLAVLGYLLWSGRMSCGYGGRHGRHWQSRFADKFDRARSRFGDEFRSSQRDFRDGASSGNHAFDDYREATLKRLEEEEREFRDFLIKLRQAKDKAEFDQFMADRKANPPKDASAGGSTEAPTAG